MNSFLQSWKIVMSFFVLSLFFIVSSSYAHALFPDDVVDLLTSNPDTTEAELSAYFEKNHGMTLDEFYKNNPFEEDPAAYDPWFDESDEYKQISRKLDLQALEKEISGLEKSGNSLLLEQANVRKQELKYAITAYDIRLLGLEPFQESFTLHSAELKYSDLSYVEIAQRFIPDGIRHVLFGWDHILFILSLLLLSLPFRKFLLLVTVFTLAHSVTLICAKLGIFSVPGSIVEPLIALSIIYTCIIGAWGRGIPFFQNTRNHFIIVFLFGLIHGLGFAGAFEQLSLETNGSIIALLSLNLGVEIAQVILLSLFFIPFWIFNNNFPWGLYVLRVISALFIIQALHWFIFRVWEFSILPEFLSL